MKTGEVVSEVLEFKHQKFEFATWTELIQLNALRDILGQGVAVHFEVLL